MRSQTRFALLPLALLLAASACVTVGGGASQEPPSLRGEVYPEPVALWRLVQASEDNVVGAQQAYGGKLVETSGFVSRVWGDGLLSGSVLLAGEYGSGSARCGEVDPNELGQLRVGERVVVTGRVRELSAALVILSSCRVRPASAEDLHRIDPAQ